MIGQTIAVEAPVTNTITMSAAIWKVRGRAAIFRLRPRIRFPHPARPQEQAAAGRKRVRAKEHRPCRLPRKAGKLHEADAEKPGQHADKGASVHRLIDRAETPAPAVSRGDIRDDRIRGKPEKGLAHALDEAPDPEHEHGSGRAEKRHGDGVRSKPGKEEGPAPPPVEHPAQERPNEHGHKRGGGEKRPDLQRRRFEHPAVDGQGEGEHAEGKGDEERRLPQGVQGLAGPSSRAPS